MYTRRKKNHHAITGHGNGKSKGKKIDVYSMRNVLLVRIVGPRGGSIAGISISKQDFIRMVKFMKDSGELENG